MDPVKFLQWFTFILTTLTMLSVFVAFVLISVLAMQVLVS